MTAAIMNYSLLIIMFIAGTGARPARAQSWVADVGIGIRNFGDDTGMMALDVRAGWQPRGWPLFPMVGWSGATDILQGTQSEFTLGIHGDVSPPAVSWLVVGAGAGATRLTQDGGDGIMGGTVSGWYALGSAYAQPLRGFMIGAEMRRTNVPDILRKDGLDQEVRFTQFALAVRIAPPRGQ